MKRLFDYCYMALMSVLLLSACSDDYEYTPAENNLTSSQAYVYAENGTSLSFVPTDAETFTVKLGRSVTTDKATVALTTTNNKFTVPSTVTFAAGQKTVDVPVTFDMAIGTTENVTIALDKNNSNPYGADSLSMTIKRDYSWKSLGEGLFTSEFFGGSWSTVVYKADGVNVYKLKDLYKEGTDIIFELSEDGKTLKTFNKQETGYVHSKYGMVSVEPDSADPMTRQDNVLTFNLNFTVSEGSFGVNKEVLELPE
ncbi:MAG: hypothetical protein WCR36_07870 [Bacteroidaceae bacterium]|nr:hypothetical protein [Prevotella sp.]